MGRVRIGASSVATIVLLAGCATADTTRLAGPPTTSAEPPAWVGGVYGPGVAAAGDDLVFAGNPCEGDDPVLRRADGTWVQLPSPPDPINVPVPVGDTVMLWGSDGCGGDAWFDDTPRLRMAMLSDDRTEWRRLDAPEIRIDSETEAVTTGWSGQAAVVFAAGANLLVDRAGVVTELPPGLAGSRVECVTDDDMVAVQQLYDTTSPVGPAVVATGEVTVLDLDAPEQGWQPRGPVPAGTTSGPAGDLCGPDGLSLIDRTTVSDYSLTGDAWASSPSNFVELAGTTEVPSAWDRRAVWSPDGSTAFVTLADRRVLARQDRGPWVDTGSTATVLVATSSEVLGLMFSITDPAENGPAPTIERLWPTG
jgi:hypothetical protein